MKYEGHLKIMFTSFIVSPKTGLIKAILLGQVVWVPMGTMWFFFDSNTYIVFMFQCFILHLMQKCFLFSPKNIFLSLSYHGWHSRIEEAREVAQVGSFMGPSEFVALQGTSPRADHSCPPKALHSLGSSLSHKTVETENVTSPTRSLATHREDSS